MRWSNALHTNDVYEEAVYFLKIIQAPKWMKTMMGSPESNSLQAM